MYIYSIYVYICIIHIICIIYIYIYHVYSYITLENITNTPMMTIIMRKKSSIFHMALTFAAQDRSEEITLVRWPGGKMGAPSGASGKDDGHMGMGHGTLVPLFCSPQVIAGIYGCE